MGALGRDAGRVGRGWALVGICFMIFIEVIVVNLFLVGRLGAEQGAHWVLPFSSYFAILGEFQGHSKLRRLVSQPMYKGIKLRFTCSEWNLY